MERKTNGPMPLTPPVPYNILPDLIPQDLDLEISGQSEPIESITPFQTTAYSLPQTPDLFNDIHSQRPPHLTTHDCSRRSCSSTASNTDSRSKTAEMRLQGALSALKSAEAQLKQKDKQIAALERDLTHKTHQLDAIQGKITASDTHQRSAALQSTLTSLMRKKEKEQNNRILELEARIDDQEKTLKRLRQINKQLVTNIKESQSASVVSEGDGRKKEDDGKRLKGEIVRLEKVNSALVHRLEETESELQVKSTNLTDLKRAFDEFQRQADGLVQHNQLLTSHLRRLLSHSPLP